MSKVAWLAAVTHIIASAAMLLLLRGGLPGPSDAERIAYIEAHGAAWMGGWMTWQVAALSLLALYVVLARRFRGWMATLALVVAAAGFSIDLTSEVKYIAVLPELRGEAFRLLDRELEVLIGYAANGLYTIAFALLAIAGRRELPRLANLLAPLVVLFGVALAVVSLMHNAMGELITSAALFPIFTLWIIVVALWLRREETA